MNRFSTAAASVALLTASVSGTANDIWSAAPKDASIKQWQAWYHNREGFFDHKDFASLNQEIDPSCKVTGPDGKRQPGNGAETLRSLFAAMSSVKADVHVLSVKKEHGAYSVMIRYKFDLVSQPGPDHKQHKIISSGNSLNVWKPTGGKMRLIEVKGLTVTNSVDGKQV